MRSCLICLLLLIALPASAQIYKYTDAAGNTAYTNQPPDGTNVQTVVLPPLNSVPTPQPQLPSSPPPVAAPNPAPPTQAYQRLAVTQIPTQEALRANNGTFTVGVDIAPRLRPGHMLQLVLDGQPYGQPSNVPQLQLVNIDRGEHTLSVQVLGNGKVVQQSDPVPFTVQRVHL